MIYISYNFKFDSNLSQIVLCRAQTNCLINKLRRKIYFKYIFEIGFKCSRLGWIGRPMTLFVEYGVLQNDFEGLQMDHQEPCKIRYVNVIACKLYNGKYHLPFNFVKTLLMCIHNYKSSAKRLSWLKVSTIFNLSFKCDWLKRVEDW